MNTNKKNNLSLAQNILKSAFVGIAFLVTSTPAFAATTVNSLTKLLPYLKSNNADVKLKSGTYTITAKDIQNGKYGETNFNNRKALFLFSGNNSTYDFSGVTITVETAVYSSFGNVSVYGINIVGNNNVLKNLKLVDSGSVHDAPKRSAVNIVIDGKNNIVQGFDVRSKGSSPYGYGDIFGKGGGALTPLRKHCGILIRGDHNTLKDTKLIHRSFGHCVFMQGANHPTIDGCYIEGELRRTDDILKEKNSLASDLNFQTIWGYKLPKGFTLALCEAGIRSYNAGTTVINGKKIERGSNDMTVTNTIVKDTRSGCNLGQGTGTRTITNVTLIGNESGFSAGQGIIKNCSADAAYGPVIRDREGVTADIRIIEPVNGYHNGSKTLATVTGAKVTLTKDGHTIPTNLKIKMGTERDVRHLVGGSLEYQLVTKFSNSIVYNHTLASVELSSESSKNTIFTNGSVSDKGSNNTIKAIAVESNPIVKIRKRNATGFALDGGNGGANGQNVYLWSYKSSNKNQQWEEINRGGGYYSYIKRDTNFAIDGGNGGAKSQNVYLWQSKSNNYNQQWKKVSTGSGTYKLVKRNAAFALDGGSGGANGQNVRLWSSSSSHQNLQWFVE